MSFQHRVVQGLGVEKRTHPPHLLGRILLVLTLLVLGTQAVQAETCIGGAVSQGNLASPPDLEVTGECFVAIGKTSYFGNVNILAGGILLFYEDDYKDPNSNNDKVGNNSKTDFWASSIIIENGGKLSAYGNDNYYSFGYRGGVLTIHLYGRKSALCKSPPGTGSPPAPCGIPQAIWDSNGAEKVHLPHANPGMPWLPTPDVYDYFYQYGPLHGDDGYFGSKVLAVSYGGILDLRGHKGTTYPPSQDAFDPCHSNPDCDPLNSGRSWMRLADGQPLEVGATSLVLERYPNDLAPCLIQINNVNVPTCWLPGDEIVVTTTDYLPGHSEKLKITSNITRNPDGTAKVDFEAVDSPTKKIQWAHNGVRYGGPNDTAHQKLTDRLPPRLKNSLDSDPSGVVKSGAETRAAVALLSRSIRIVSEGEQAGETFDRAASRTECNTAQAEVPGDRGESLPPVGNKTGCYYFGAHMVIRQGFAAVQIQGVEFVQMGQGGRLGHYPVHFHKARQTPAYTYVKDSSINESMTRWIVLHSTLGVTVQRNVGYKSIGHGFYLEDGTETDNKFYSNIGIFARAAVDNKQNPRRVPGILAANQEKQGVFLKFPFLTDSTYPSVFWITNGWNDFRGNMAAGAGACGTAYWFVPVFNSDRPDVPTAANVQDGMHMKWSGYAALQNNLRGTTPLKSFYKNYATSTMMSFQTTGDASPCHGVVKANDAATENVLKVVKSIAPDPDPTKDERDDHYYPHARGGNRHATRCPLGTDGTYNCAGIRECGPGQRDNCAVTVLDHFTSAFHWAEYAIAAIWLRNQWYLMSNSVLSDVQNGGLTFITGGDYTHASVIQGYWALVRNSLFIGRTQPSNAFARDAGPFNTASGLECDWQRQLKQNPKAGVDKSYCLSGDEGISIPLTPSFGLGQQLFHVYDGPAYQDSNAYLDIKATPCPNPGCMYNSGSLAGVPKDKSGSCYLPNAAIGWKQPNGFYYPPAFHSTNLFFSNVDIRHYVVDPLFQAPAGITGSLDFGQGGTYLTDKKRTGTEYCGPIADNFFEGFTGIDRQTILNDDDGSLTGLVNTVKVAEPAQPGKPANPGEPARLKQTISVNEDSFFDAPVKTAECKSNVGVDPDKACPKQGKLPATPTPSTAMTSPYDYVTTVIVPGCSLSTSDPSQRRFGRCDDDAATEQKTCSKEFPNCCEVPGNFTSANICRDRFSKMTGRGGTWSSECSNESCYGVPLYRQFLTGNDGKDGNPATREWAHWFAAKCDKNRNTPRCRWPFMRMAGANIYQRNTLTVNHGTYFLDTSVPRDVQYGNVTAKTVGEQFNNITPCDVAEKDHCKPRSVNVFTAGQTYYVFFLYAKPSTEQTYQIYVGNGFETGSVMGVQMNISGAPVSLAQTFPTRPTWLKEPTVDNGILTVNVDFKGVTDLEPTADNLCQPKTFCQVKKSTQPNEKSRCVSALVNSGDNKDPLLVANSALEDEVNKVCGTWAVKDLDCPKDGCFGFSFKLPSKFLDDPPATIAGPAPYRPAPNMFPTTNAPGQPDWKAKFERTTTAPDNAAKGACFYPDPLPGEKGCDVVEPTGPAPRDAALGSRRRR
jgi:cell migration-inducing and hyaluronan-binding protein